MDSKKSGVCDSIDYDDGCGKGFRCGLLQKTRLIWGQLTLQCVAGVTFN